MLNETSFFRTAIASRLRLWPDMGVSGDFFRVGEVRRSEVRDAVAAHRAAQREEIRREEAIAGRRLTAAELFELRQQVRGQWTPPAWGLGEFGRIAASRADRAGADARRPFADRAAQPAPLRCWRGCFLRCHQT
jgi:hypothetical protein